MSNLFKKKLYGINLPEFEKKVKTNYLNAKSLSHQEISNGIILPLKKSAFAGTEGLWDGGVCDQEFNFIAGYKRADNDKFNSRETVRAYVPTEAVDVIDEEVIFGGIAYDHFGHFLVESFCRLWWIVQNAAIAKDKKVIFLKNKEFDSPFLKLLTYVGLKEEQIVFLNNPTKFKKIYIPEQSLCYFSYYNKEYVIPYNEIVNRLSTQKTIKSGNKIYLSRTKLAKKDFVNEEYFESFYRDLGYEIVYPEQLSIEDQVCTIASADEIVSTIGTLSHLALFAKKGAKIITLMRSRSNYNTTQGMINQAKELDSALIDVTCNFLPNHYMSNCFYIGPTASWKEFVKDYYGITLDVDLLDYLNTENSHIGDYFKLWIKIFSQNPHMNRIRNYSSTKILDTLEVIFSETTGNFSTLASSLPTTDNNQDNVKFINLLKGKIFTSTKCEHSQLVDMVKGKIFKFSRFDDSYMRLISLNDDGTIQSIGSKNHPNESFWKIEKDQLLFLSKEKKVTGRFFYIEKNDNDIQINGYYELNHSIWFKLKEVNL